MAARDSVTRIGAIVVHADLRDPDLDVVLDAHENHGGGLFRGIRHSGARLEDPSARLLAGAAEPGLYADPDFRRGVTRLGERGLTFDAFQFHFQAEQFIELAKAAPGTTMIVNHLGTPIGYTPGPATDDPVFVEWTKGVEPMAELPNVVMKLGGIASIVTGYDAHIRDAPPSSQEFVDERGAYFHHAIRCFGAERCMFESNFPVDSVAIGYAGLWNAYKIIAMDYDASARNALLAGTARRIYRMQQEAASE
jgi:predicted TIM-barrel fold metal-dependent hydrolase